MTIINLSSFTLDLNDQFLQAFRLMEESNKHLFITGKAGTGKSTLLDYFRSKTKKKIVVLAPTGVAAINVRGSTIHKFFGFKPDITPEKVRHIRVKEDQVKLYQQLDALIIDEISMVRADLLDCVDYFLRLHGPHSQDPFGGVQMIFIGDLYQLPPVVTTQEKYIFQNLYASPYFFSAQVLSQVELELVELEKIYRQKDNQFISILNAIRNNSATSDHLLMLNQRHAPDFIKPKQDFYVSLTTTNAAASALNCDELLQLKGKTYTYPAIITGDFTKESFPTDPELTLKPGSQVMMLTNERNGLWVNGTMGKVVKIKQKKDGDDRVEVELEDGHKIEVEPFTWEIFKFSFNERKQKLESESVGTFTQYPMRLAWAITIHKSQGKTFDKVIVDIGRGTFSHGQMYVALSRCRTLEGMVLRQAVTKKHILLDWRVVNFMTKFQYGKAESMVSAQEKRALLQQALENNDKVEFLYLKANDEKSRRVLQPSYVGEMEYQGKRFIGVAGFDSKSQEDRTFRIDRILEIKVV